MILDVDRSLTFLLPHLHENKVAVLLLVNRVDPAGVAGAVQADFEGLDPAFQIEFQEDAFVVAAGFKECGV